MSETIELIRAITRPIITVVFDLSWIAITTYLITNGIGISVPYVLLTVVAWGVTVWWYNDRTFFHRHQSPLDIITPVGK